MTESTVNITKVEENFFDKISFVNAENSTGKIENPSIDSSMIKEVQLLNAQVSDHLADSIDHL